MMHGPEGVSRSQEASTQTVMREMGKLGGRTVAQIREQDFSSTTDSTLMRAFHVHRATMRNLPKTLGSDFEAYKRAVEIEKNIALRNISEEHPGQYVGRLLRAVLRTLVSLQYDHTLRKMEAVPQKTFDQVVSNALDKRGEMTEFLRADYQEALQKAAPRMIVNPHALQEAQDGFYAERLVPLMTQDERKALLSSVQYLQDRFPLTYHKVRIALMSWKQFQNEYGQQIQQVKEGNLSQEELRSGAYPSVLARLSQEMFSISHTDHDIQTMFATQMTQLRSGNVSQQQLEYGIHRVLLLRFPSLWQDLQKSHPDLFTSQVLEGLEHERMSRGL